MAAGWFYADVAHANPTGWKELALQFSRATRFEAAVPRFSLLALTTMSTLGFVRQLQDDGLLALPAEALEPDLATDRPVPEKTVLMFAPPGTAAPSLTGEPLGAEWQQLNVGNAARLLPGNRVDIVLSHDGQEVIRRPGAILGRGHPSDDTYTMQVLVDEAIMLSIESSPQTLGSGGFRMDSVWATNMALSDGLRLLQAIHASDTLAITWDGLDLFKFNVDPGDGAPPGTEVAAYVDDVAAIESVLDVKLPLVEHVPNADRRLNLHVARLAMEGAIVSGPSGAVIVTTTNGAPPTCIHLSVSPLVVEGHELALRPLLVWHPQAQVESHEEPGKYRVTVPSGERFCIWDPTVTNIQQPSDLTPTA